MPSSGFRSSQVLAFLKNFAHRFFRRALRRRVVCCALALNLLVWPGPGVVTQHFIALASEALDSRIGSYSYEAVFLRRLLSQSAGRPRRETTDERSASVSFNYPSSPSSLTDAPSFSQWTQYPAATSGGTATYSITSGSGFNTKSYTITNPNSSTVTLTRSTASGIANGLLTQTEIKTSGGASMWK